MSRLLRELILAVDEAPSDALSIEHNRLVARLILLELDKARRLRLRLPLPRDPRLQRLCATLLADPSDTRTLADWSRVAGASERTLSRLFAQEMGLSFLEWRRRMRFQNALEALSKGEPISRVAAENGYRSSSAFAAAFRRSMGFKPSQAR